MHSISTNAQFDALVRSGTPFVIDFYADWCGPCQMMRPRLERLSKEYRGKVKMIKVNIDQAQKLAKNLE